MSRKIAQLEKRLLFVKRFIRVQSFSKQNFGIVNIKKSHLGKRLCGMTINTLLSLLLPKRRDNWVSHFVGVDDDLFPQLLLRWLVRWCSFLHNSILLHVTMLSVCNRAICNTVCNIAVCNIAHCDTDVCNTGTHIHTETHTHTRTHAQTHTHTHTHERINTHTHAHIYIYIYTQTTPYRNKHINKQTEKWTHKQTRHEECIAHLLPLASLGKSAFSWPPC